MRQELSQVTRRSAIGSTGRFFAFVITHRIAGSDSLKAQSGVAPLAIDYRLAAGAAGAAPPAPPPCPSSGGAGVMTMSTSGRIMYQ